ncbi:heat shock protein 15 [Sulfurimicrobium lacus]|uniref:Heat shock protein 15 n=1 Tax=Sulfurimicrobium lacus TaxID=2715678 RepID=A0A6F8VA07_9PROT|nr:S4 domain-containing protein [Sulfurimicrobium lacus]BCB26494.1 heat shock protein 15 [Sulfurimicrobium lacus]
MDEPGAGKVRIDKWLWAARFFKTRSLASQAVDGGKVHCNGDRVKPARAVHTGDELRIRQGPYELIVLVRALSERRGPASEAVLLYEETPASIATREVLKEQLRIEPVYENKGRPTKRDRRHITRFNEGH